MCQLTLTNLGSRDLNLLWVLTSSYLNTNTTNKDGFGLFTQKQGIWKTENTPSILINLGTILTERIVDDFPVISHVRQASLNNGNRKILPEFSHPFETGNLVLAHNGALEFKDWKDKNDKKWEDKIDSQVFLEILDEKYLENKKDLPASLVKTMELFKGKFAFLIFEKKTKDYYVIRGNSADLYKVDISIKEPSGEIKPVGFVVNTDDKSLKSTLIYYRNYLQITKGLDIFYDYKQINELEKETIYKLNNKTNELVKIGEIKETERWANNSTSYKNRGTYNNTYYDNKHWDPITKTWVENVVFKKDNTRKGITDLFEISAENLDVIENISKFIRDCQISVYYFDELLKLCVGKSIAEAQLKDLKEFNDIYVEHFRSNNNKMKRKLWERILTKTTTLDTLLHKEYNLQFPYWLNKNDVLKDLESRLKTPS